MSNDDYRHRHNDAMKTRTRLALLLLAWLITVTLPNVSATRQKGRLRRFLENDVVEARSTENSNVFAASGTKEVDILAKFEQMESYKTSTLWSSNPQGDGRKTLSRLHFVIVPIWFADEAQDTSVFDTATTTAVMQRTARFYRQMSWSKFSLTWDIVAPMQLKGITSANPSLGRVQTATEIHVNTTLRLVSPVDYTAVMALYQQPQSGDMANGGGWATMNGNFVWMTAPGDFYIIRHEIGHVMGHAHHGANIYDWRIPATFTYDGFDLMSGGGYNTSDFAAASKWHYNWIPNEAVVVMQPPLTPSCPDCLSSITNLILRPFDVPAIVPSATNQMAVHIPILGDSTSGLYSYWLSYRGTSVEGRGRRGLSIHLTTFYGLGGPFGAFYDSVNMDAVGETPETTDSFVLPNTCYVVTPPVMLLMSAQSDYEAAHRVQPVVCVNEITLGSSISISVLFLDTKATRPSNPFLSTQQTVGCGSVVEDGSPKQLDVSNGKRHLLSFTGTGLGGSLSLSFCRTEGSTASVSAYVYDAYPHAYLTYGAPLSYGTFKRVRITATCPTVSKLEYLSYGETHVLIVSSSGTGSVQSKADCTMTRCFANQYSNNQGTCTPCPVDTASEVGSTNLASCIAIPNVNTPIAQVPTPVRVPNPVAPLPRSSPVRPMSPVTVPTSGGTTQQNIMCSQSGIDVAKCRRVGGATGFRIHRKLMGVVCVERCVTLRRLIFGRDGWQCGRC